ncbi:hypothetical protein [Rhodococcus sp. IEGM 1379]|uniref:hypothetical protein n=1 Tax=Rhodococcus sp. IEGM 1379 TaxID=3047086 RepID=UPI0024B72F6C|nr:hypothetical protein [Rhodococcus sp. IEGM 1379]MDI9917310.1 hypothetical protein [Rhodococcus sp. IEGM 1379]
MRSGAGVLVLAVVVAVVPAVAVSAQELPSEPMTAETASDIPPATDDDSPLVGTGAAGASGGLSAPFNSFAPVAGRPADLPIGVTFEALSRAPGGVIKINGEDVRDTTDRNHYSIAVIDRGTREVKESGTVNLGATSYLSDIARRYPRTNGYLMVISGFRGVVDQRNLDALAAAVSYLGGRPLTDDERSLLRSGHAFSVVGIPGGAAGGAFITVDKGDGIGPQGNVYGYLQVNTATDQYGVVNPENPTFDTTNTASTPGASEVLFDHKRYATASSQVLGAGQSGFQVLAFDQGLANTKNVTVATNGTSDDAAAQTRLATEIQDAAQASGSTVVVQSIGHPVARSKGWSDAAVWIERLGGNRLAFNNLAADSDYSLVGSLTAGPAAIEASSILGRPGPIAGGLARNRDMVFTPTSGGPAGGTNTELIDISYQAPQSFPAFTTGHSDTTAAGTAAADLYIGRTLGICAQATPVCSVRTEYYRSFKADWHTVATDLDSRRLDYPGDGRNFTEADYTAVRTQLGSEISMVNRVRTYFAALQQPFGEAAQQGAIDLDKITKAVIDSIGAPNDSGTTSFVLGLIGKIVALGGFAGPPVSAVAAGLSAAFGLGAYLSQPSGPPQLVNDVQVRASELGRTARAQMLATSRSITGLTLLVLSDYGKLTATAARLPTTKWTLPNDTGPTIANLTLAAQRSAAEKLVPLVFPWLLRGTPLRSAQSMSCKKVIPRVSTDIQVHVWKNQPANAALNVRDYFTAEGSDIPAPYWFAKASLDEDRASPPASLTNMLFDPANPATGTLGINQQDFINPRIFGAAHQANDAAPRCDLRGVPQSPSPLPSSGSSGSAHR